MRKGESRGTLLGYLIKSSKRRGDAETLPKCLIREARYCPMFIRFQDQFHLIGGESMSFREIKTLVTINFCRGE